MRWRSDKQASMLVAFNNSVEVLPSEGVSWELEGSAFWTNRWAGLTVNGGQQLTCERPC